MKDEGSGLFAREDEVLARALRVAAQAASATAEELSRELASLAAEYRRLLRQQKHLTRISDRSHSKLHTTTVRLDSELGRQVGAEIKQDLLRSRGRELRVRRQDLTVMFMDLRGFTTLAESMQPDDVIAFLKAYYEFSLGIVHAHGGLVKSFMGDGLMVVFGYNREDPCADQGLTCAGAILARLEGFNRGQGRELRLGIGLHSGATAAGHIGTEERSELAVIGNTVNLASRIQGATKQHGVPLLFSGEVRRALRQPPPDVEHVVTTQLRGQTGSVELYTLRRLRGAPGEVAAAPSSPTSP